jgi:2',3'-cyclic-nucleotide 2'-phosphodiesterase (5'-nucleotidase family)
LKRLLPGHYEIRRIQASGEQIWKSLENGVSKYPALEGRFPMVSGISFSFNPYKEPFSRIPIDSITINGEKVIFDKLYTLAVREYIYLGYDGYEELPKCKNIDNTPEIGHIFDIVMKFFNIVKDLKEDFTTKENESFLEEGIFGFDLTNKFLIDYLKQVVYFVNKIPHISIHSPSRITLLTD